MEFLRTLNGGIYTLAAAFFMFVVARLFRERKKAGTWEGASVTLSVKRWFIVIAVLLLISQVDTRLYEYGSKRIAEAGIEQPDPLRLSILVPDFSGTGGPEAADTIAAMLQSSLGAGVQIIRIPQWYAEKRYGDVDTIVTQTAAQTLLCAAHYNGDVVIWGESLPGSQQVKVNYTAKNDDCMPRCGVAKSRFPRLYLLADARNPRSQLAADLSESVVTELRLAVTQRGEAAAASHCLDNPTVGKRLAAKADALLTGAPQGLSSDDLYLIAGSAALFHQKNFEHSQDLSELDRAIDDLEGIQTRLPAQASLSAGLFSHLLVDRANRSSDARQLARLASRGASLVPIADRRDRISVQKGADELQELAFYRAPGRPKSALDNLERYFAAREAKEPDNALHFAIRIAGARAAFMEEQPGLERHEYAFGPDRRAFELLHAQDPSLKTLSVGDRCTLARADLTLTNVHNDPASLAHGFNRDHYLVSPTNIIGADFDCAEAYHLLAQNLMRLSDALPSAGDQLLRPAVRFESEVRTRDKTHRSLYNDFMLAYAQTRLAEASHLPDDRREAIKFLTATRQAAARVGDRNIQKNLENLLRKLGGTVGS